MLGGSEPTDEIRPVPRLPTLVDRAKGGDDEAWKALILAHTPTIRRYLYARGLKDLDDGCQEVWLRARRGLESLRGDESKEAIGGWLCVIAYHWLVDESRRRRRRVTEVAPTRPLDPPSKDDPAEEVASTEWVSQLFNQLPWPQNEIMRLTYTGNLTSAAIAPLLNLRPAAVRTAHRRALQRLAAQLGRDFLGRLDN
jgi:RNA polymerase sigma-70 factor (ECF subfamily)